MNDETIEVLKRIEKRLSLIEEKLSAVDVASELDRDVYSCEDVSKLTGAHGLQRYAPYSIRLACSDGRIPDAYKRHNGRWAIPKAAVLRILGEGVPPERRQ
ncbi:MAG: hypothetical protein KDB23_02425 [Planctomycetales bacterium]|nr:hypothetical protein [Planctomycetales bacterium]